MKEKLTQVYVNDYQNNQLPQGWVWVRLQDIAEKINPGFPSGRHNKDKRGIPHLRPMNINIKGEIDLSEVKYVQPETYDPLSKGDVLFNNTNSPELLGKTSFISKNTNWAYSNHMTRLRFNTSLINSAWISHTLHTLFLNGFFRMSCTHHVNQASINSTFLSEKVFLPFPPLNEQKRIVSKLEELFTKLDAGIEYLRKTEMLLKQYHQSVLKYALEGNLTEEWRSEKNRNISIVKKNSESVYADELISIPKSWDWIPLCDISIKITDGEHFRPKTVSSGIPFLSAKDITEKAVVFDNALYVTGENAEKMRKRCNPEKDDILIVSRGATIGRTCLINSSKIFCLLGSVILIKLLKKINKKFITYMIKSHDIQKKLTSISGSTAQQAIYLRDIKNIKIPVPPFEEQNIIANRLDYIFSIYENTLNNIKITLKETKNLRNTILRNAFEGKLVPQEPNDEPAIMLLQKIKDERSEEMRSFKTKRNKIKTINR